MPDSIEARARDLWKALIGYPLLSNAESVFVITAALREERYPLEQRIAELEILMQARKVEALHLVREERRRVWEGLKVTNEQLAWALKELGPIARREEAYVKATVEYVIACRQQAQEEDKP